LCIPIVFQKYAFCDLKFQGTFSEATCYELIVVEMENPRKKLENKYFSHQVHSQLLDFISQFQNLFGIEFGRFIRNFLPHHWDINILTTIQRFLLQYEKIAIVKFRHGHKYYKVYTPSTEQKLSTGKKLKNLRNIRLGRLFRHTSEFNMRRNAE